MLESQKFGERSYASTSQPTLWLA